MKREMKKHCLPENYRKDLLLKMHSLQQGGQNVEEYTREFEQLMMKCDIVETQEQTIARYMGGLKQGIADAVDL